MYLDYVTYCTAEGDRIILELQAAKFLIKSLKEAKANKPLSGAVTYLNVCAKPGFCVDDIPMCKASTQDQFQDLDTCVSLFAYRALTSVVRASTRLDSLQKQGVSSSEAWRMCAVDLVTASRWHCQYVILSNFVEEVEAVKDVNIRAALGRVCALYALADVQENQGGWLGHMSTSQASAVREAVRHLLTALRPDAVALVDAFEFPDNTLNSALGRRDGNVYEALYESAVASPLNKHTVLPEYRKTLLPHLDHDFLREGRQRQGSGLRARL